jgi:hypothetical protein
MRLKKIVMKRRYMFRTRNHSIIRFIFDILLLIILFFLIVSPIYLTFILKISDLDLKVLGVEKVAGSTVTKN